MTAPQHALSGDEVVRRVLEDLAIAGERGNPDGVSMATMARAIGVSHEQMRRVIAGERHLTLSRLVSLPLRAFGAAMSALQSARATRTATGTIESCIADVLANAGEWISLAAGILSDGKADANEQVKARLKLVELRDQIDAVIARFDRETRAEETT